MMVQPLHFTRTLGWTLALCLPFAASAYADPSASRVESPQFSVAHPHSVSTIARGHWQAISQGNVTTIMEDYSPDAVFHWKEGAFEGNHIGAEAIRTVWIKFAKVRSPLTLTVTNVQESGGSKGSRVVTADVALRNADWTYPLAYRIVFRGGKIIEETWQTAEPDPVLLGV